MLNNLNILQISALIYVYILDLKHLDDIDSGLRKQVVDYIYDPNFEYSKFVNHWPIPIKVKSLVAIIELMIKLLKRELEEDIRVWIEGYPHPEGANVF